MSFIKGHDFQGTLRILTLATLVFFLSACTGSKKSAVTSAETETPTIEAPTDLGSLFDDELNSGDTAGEGDDLPAVDGASQEALCLASGYSSAESAQACLSSGSYSLGDLYGAASQSFGVMAQCYQIAVLQGKQLLTKGYSVTQVYDYSYVGMTRCYQNLVQQQAMWAQWNQSIDRRNQERNQAFFLLLTNLLKDKNDNKAKETTKK